MTRVLVRAALLGAALALAPACDVLPPIDLERMIYQDRFSVWQRCPYLPDDRELQAPPDGTIPRDAASADPALQSGIVGGAYVEQIPLPLTRELVLRGRSRFETFCATCHGLRGDGVSVVARNMDLRRPPSIAGTAARALPAGRIYQVIHDGYGLMRSYAEDLSTPEERWSVVAYLRALQASQASRLDDLPTDLRREAEEHLR